MSSDTKLKHTSHENAVAADIFDYFCNANTMKHILGLHREICEILNLKPNRFPEFYPKFKHMLSSSWKAQAFFKKFDVRASLSEYEKGFACKSTKVLIIGAGPCGLRAAIESQLLGAKVVVLEKRDRITRNNVVHLWPFVIEDLKALGGKKFYGKFCAGSIDHISIRQLQCMLLKMALCLGVEIHESVEFKELLEPTTTENSEKIGWRASVSPVDHPVSEYEFDCLIGADGRRNTLSGFTRKEFRGKMALAITANFINRKTEEEAAVPEISGVSYIFRQKFFQDMLEHTGVDLENIVYYKDETHYFVMTAKKQSLLEKGVLKTDNYDVNKLLALDNMDMTALYNYAKEAAQYATNNALPFYDFALNHYGNPDVALFDFTSVYAADNASHVRVRMGHKLLIQLVGDSLIEPFWPTGSGIARGFLSVLDAAWAIKMWAADYDIHPMTIVTERESIYRLLAQTTPENLNNNLSGYTINPRTRYKTLNRSSFSSLRVRKLYTSDKSKSEKSIDGDTRQSKVTTMPPEVLLRWAKGGAINVRELVTPEHLASLLRRYRPDLLSFDIPDEAVYSVLEKYFQIDPLRSQDETKIVNYLSKIYHTFKGELPHVSRESDYYNALKREKKIFSNPPALNLSHPKLPDDRRSRKRRVSHNDFPTQGPIRSYPYETLTDAANKDNDDRKDTVKSEKRIPDWKLTTRQRNLSGTEPTTSDMGSKDRLERKSASRERRLQEWKTKQRNVAPSGLTLEPSTSKVSHKKTGTDKKHDPSSIYKRMPESYTRQNRRPVVRDHVSKLREVGKLDLQKFSDILSINKDSKKIGDAEREVAFLLEDDLRSNGVSHERIKAKLLKQLSDDRDGPDDDEAYIRRMAMTRKASVSQVDFKEKVKTVENLLQQIGDGLKRPGGQSKPKDLLRSVGKINKEDWNVKEIEKKIEENRMGKPVPKAAEKVPKWDKEQFLRSKRRLTTTSVPDEKWQAVDETIIKLDLKLRDSGRPDQGTNKVADLATMFVKKDEPEPVNNNTTTVDAPKNSWQGTKIAKVDCAACNRRVFAAESVIADGLQLHKTCFRCAICKAALRPGGYTFDRDDSRLYCLRHGERIRTLDNAIYTPASIQGDEPLVILPSIKTPERLSSIDVQEGGEIDEDEWTDRNFLASGTSGADKSSDEDSSADTYSDAESYTEEIAERASTPYALDMHGLHRQMHYVSDDSYGDDDFSDGVESSEKDSCSRFREAREARRQEVPQAKIPQQQTDSSEVESEEESSESSERSSATAVSTDSEFEEEVPTAPDPPAITVTIAPIEEPKVFQSREYPLNRARSSGGIASKRALELKRRYLLGESNQPAVRKSDSTSRLDTKLETFQETISEFQKLLNPAPLPASQPTSKPIAFQSYFDKTSMPDVVLNVRKEPDLLAKADTPLPETEVKKEENSSPEQKEPVEISNIESSSDTESSVTETLTKSVPRVEVHDEVGELIQLDSLMIIPSEESKDDKTTVTQPTQSSSTPIPARDTDSSDSCKYATLPLTDTEWEWAADNTVLEDCTLDESRCQRNVNKKNPRTLSSPKLVHDAKNISAISSHVCGRTSPTIVYSNALDHFQFADEGEQDINPISNPTNDGYMELVDDGYIDYSPDNDRSMSYILKNSEVCQPMFKEEEAPEDKTPVAERIIADDIVEKELCKLTNTKSEPALSPVSLIPTQEKVLEIKREREQQTEVVRRLVLDRLGKSPMESRKSYRKPRQLPVSTPPPVPPPMNSEPPVMPTLPPRPALPVNPYPANVPEEPKHNRIMDGLSNFLSKWHSEPDLSTHITILNSSRNNNVSGTLPVSEAPPVPPLPAQYCPQSTSEIRPRHNEHPISNANDDDERDAMQLWFEARWARLVAGRRQRESRRSRAEDPAARRLARIERKLSRPLNAEQQASAVAELVQVSAQQDAHKAMLAADRRRTRNSTAD